MHVIIFIHGGAFMFNNGGTYGPKILMDNDVVYVSLNYRLGPLGFLSTEDEVVPGNNGLRDQIVALEWIKDNIRQFGGNADSITLAGMSAGGASVHFHTMSPLTRDKTLIQSGTALNNWVLVEHSRAKATRLGSIVGCDMTNIAHMVGCMKTKPAKQIVAASKQFQPYMYNPFSPFGVVVDSWATNPVLPVHPYLYLLSKEIQHVPVIFSHVQAEGLYPAADFIGTAGSLEEINEQWNELIPFILDFNNTIPASQRDKTSQAIRKHYFGDSPVNRDSIDRLVQMVTDRLFVADIQKAAVMHAKASQQPVYYYNYYYRAAYSKSNYRSKSLENFGTSHGDDTICVLSSNVNCHSNKQDRRMSRVLQDIWVNFNKNRNQQFRDVEWIPLRNNAERPDVLRINSPDDIHMEANADLGNNQFWQNQMFSENERIIGSEKVEL